MNITIDSSVGMALTFEPRDSIEAAIQGIYILLNTMKGEVPCYREFGIDGAYIHKPIKTAQTMYAAAMTEAVARFLPNVEINKISFSNDASESSTLRPILEVTIHEQS